MVDFDVLGFFKEEIMNDAAAIRIEAVSNLKIIASALGPAKTISELVPYLVQAIDEDKFKSDEEFLCKVAAGLGELPEFMNNKNLEILIPPLESLAGQEETVIREAAVESLCSVISRNTKLCSEYLVPCLHRLATTTDFFTARVSACLLFPRAYEYADVDQKANLRKVFVTICGDETPMVRRAAAKSMTALAKEMGKLHEKDMFISDLASTYKMLSSEDTQDTIRVDCINTTIQLAKMFSEEENLEHTVNVITAAVDDRSWRVRLTVAQQFPNLCVAFGPALVDSHLINCHSQLLKDQEFEVRKEALSAIKALGAAQFTNELLQNLLLPLIPQLQNDGHHHVRASLASLLGALATKLGREPTQRSLMKSIEALMQDDCKDVRLNAVEHAATICEVVGVDAMTPLIGILKDLKEDTHWRIRDMVVTQVPKLASLLGEDSFATTFEPLVLDSLKDSVYEVRCATVKQLSEIAKRFGGNWATTHMIPKLINQYSQPSGCGYANRMTTINALGFVSQALNQDQIREFVIPTLLKATKDSVPNVRFRALMHLDQVIGKNPSFYRELASELQQCVGDSDCDVQFYAQMALLKNQG
jgi:serine/threonine-protein phosphatase 2A regulatory subunit A